MSKKNIERGQSITFRVPSDTPDYLLKQLQKLKETERRNFSSQIAQFVLKGVNETYTRERETITVPLPKQLTKEQKSWLKHEHSEALIGSILYQLLSDPMRATTLLASLNSNTSDIDEALYLQEEAAASKEEQEQPISIEDNALDDLNLDGLNLEQEEQEQEQEEEDPLGDFFSKMNK
ncbi:ribosomal protein L12E/L44/L45/RPP1/RPP2 [Virgibacillus halotolerans]|uniref:hypothetical protein n=1 Tax=Virgibacillus halotolerans TaxID=1071053 RepID=UPI00195FFD18|nr:hypothetical protein [Virgibacillus halotolerans]MBM7600803.1 ribosomal protein L12E/L44/L45/RPP1/RPP2 [Virgibacillus halotolerans]